MCLQVTQTFVPPVLKVPVRRSNGFRLNLTIIFGIHLLSSIANVGRLVGWLWFNFTFSKSRLQNANRQFSSEDRHNIPVCCMYIYELLRVDADRMNRGAVPLAACRMCRCRCQCDVISWLRLIGSEISHVIDVVHILEAFCRCLCSDRKVFCTNV